MAVSWRDLGRNIRSWTVQERVKLTWRKNPLSAHGSELAGLGRNISSCNALDRVKLTSRKNPLSQQ
jgi:hypothetical protein